METIGTHWIWIGFTVFVLAMLALEVAEGRATTVEDELKLLEHQARGLQEQQAALRRRHARIALPLKAEESGPLF